MSATFHLEKPVNEETKFWPRFETVIYGDTYVTVLSGKVKPFAWYCIKMLGFTRKGEGPETSCVFVLTEESGKAHTSMLLYLVLFIRIPLLNNDHCLLHCASLNVTCVSLKKYLQKVLRHLNF